MNDYISTEKPEIWGGIECTINRLGDQYKDQLEYSGHYSRTGDLEAIAELGIRALRYPVLWEKHQPDNKRKIDWSWTDKQMAVVRDSGITLIAGLLHHGSGPSFTNLLDPQFPQLMASYAYKVANRYPWIENYTPINEPLTTARFSGLYGHWYPHHQNEHSFYRMLLNQLKATVLCMDAIHSVNPAARLIQTEDLGKTYSTPLLSYQAEFENQRRLLTFDILTGKLKAGHPQYQYIVDSGITENEINYFQNHTVVPDILGLNYYVTSERWLDESYEKYDSATHGGNGIHQYADTEFVRSAEASGGGFKNLATEIWDRYQLPMAVTESHLHCTREEQLRWFKEIWDDSITLASKGIPVKAVTSWALLGSFDWDTLLTESGSQYESGAFDIKSFPGKLRSTALVELVKHFATGEGTLHPVLAEKGWWHAQASSKIYISKPILIIINKPEEEDSISERLRNSLIEACCLRKIPTITINSDSKIDFLKINPWAIINMGPADKKLRSVCRRMGFQFVTFTASDPADSCLSILAQQANFTSLQINTVLDLIIDRETGCWILRSDETLYKLEARPSSIAMEQPQIS